MSVFIINIIVIRSGIKGNNVFNIVLINEVCVVFDVFVVFMIIFFKMVFEMVFGLVFCLYLNG